MREKTALKLLMERAKMTLEARFFSWSRPESPYVVGRSLRKATQIKIIHASIERYKKFPAPCYSQSLLLADFKENHSLLWF